MEMATQYIKLNNLININTQVEVCSQYNNRKIVQQLDLNGKLINEDFTENMAKLLGVSTSAIYGAINRNNTCQGYKLQYKEAI